MARFFERHPVWSMIIVLAVAVLVWAIFAPWPEGLEEVVGRKRVFLSALFNGITLGALYFLVPRLWNRERLHSLAAVNWHFWLATIGIVLYAASMWVTGIMEGLMWREVDANGFLVNSFADTVAAKFPMYVVRGLGGVLYLTGALIMTWNLWMTPFGKERPQSAMQPAE